MKYSLLITTKRAGYPIFRSSVEYYNYICDLGDRLEVNLESGETVNIWIDETEETEAAVKCPKRKTAKNILKSS